MSSVFLLWIKWLFWLRRWKEVLHVYIHDLQLNTVPNAIILYNSLALILGIILHDVIQKMIKLFYFSRFKPSSLQFTVFQSGIQINILLSNIKINIEILVAIYWQYIDLAISISISKYWWQCIDNILIEQYQY